MERDDLRQRLSSGVDELWWRYRFLEDVVGAPKAAPEDHEQAVDCFVRLAVADPSWAATILDDRGPSGHRLGRLLDRERVHRAMETISLQTGRNDRLLRARMLIASVRWAARGGDNPQSLAVWLEAWQELLQVQEAKRGDAWNALALISSARVAYDHYPELAKAHAAKLEPFDLSHFLPDALGVAFRNDDWPTYEAWAVQYGALPEALRHGHSAVAVINLEGLRALKQGRLEDAERRMRELLALAEGLTFLSNDDVSSLARRLRESNLCLDLCEAFDQLVERRDWRNLRK